MVSPRLTRLALACLALFLITASMASAQTQAMWRMYIKAADTDDHNSNGDMTVGVFSSAHDGYGIDGTASDTEQDGRASFLSTSQRAVVGVFDNKAWIRDVKSPRLPGDPAYDAGQAIGPGNPGGSEVYGAYPWEANRKIWDLRVAGLGTASTLDTVLTIRFVSTVGGLPPLTLPVYGSSPATYCPVRYRMRMVDNKGMAGAPANGTVWSIPVPAAWQSAAFFSLTLPTMNVLGINEWRVINEGYKMEFWQEQVVPEPGSLMALGCGLIGLLGLVRRRR